MRTHFGAVPHKGHAEDVFVTPCVLADRVSEGEEADEETDDEFNPDEGFECLEVFAPPSFVGEVCVGRNMCEYEGRLKRVRCQTNLGGFDRTGMECDASEKLRRS